MCGNRRLARERPSFIAIPGLARRVAAAVPAIPCHPPAQFWRAPPSPPLTAERTMQIEDPTAPIPRRRRSKCDEGGSLPLPPCWACTLASTLIPPPPAPGDLDTTFGAGSSVTTPTGRLSPPSPVPAALPIRRWCCKRTAQDRPHASTCSAGAKLDFCLVRPTKQESSTRPLGRAVRSAPAA